MAWNKNNYYFQNQMKVLSGSDPEPGYKEDDPTSAPSNLDQRIQENGLYRFVSLIKSKLNQLKNTNWSLINIDPKSKDRIDKSHPSNGDLNYFDGTNNYNENDGEYNTIGNFYNGRNHDADWRETNHYPEHIDTENYSSKIKVSTVSGQGGKPDPDTCVDGIATYGARQDLLHNMNPNRYVRLHSTDGHDEFLPEGQKLDDDRWTPWYVFVPMTEKEAYEMGLIDDNGQPQGWGKIFLKRQGDWTTGSIGFGKDPAMGGEDYTMTENIKAKIVLGEYTYGTDLPENHYASGQFRDSEIPKGQIYLQYTNEEPDS